MYKPVFSLEQDLYARLLLSQKAVRIVEFSHGVYQCEVEDKEDTWHPFIQIDDRGHILEGLCSCPATQGCSHVLASYLSLFTEDSRPHHVRFVESLWYAMAFAASSLSHEWCIGKTGAMEAFSLEEKRIFAFLPRHVAMQEKLGLLIQRHQEENESNSLKFFLRSEEELEGWRKGRPSRVFAFDLSFFSDLAKELWQLEEEGEVVERVDTAEEMIFRFSSVECIFRKTPELAALQPVVAKQSSTSDLPPFFASDDHQASLWLAEKENEARLLLPFQKGMFVPHYHLFLDEAKVLHVELFLFAPGDMQAPEARILGRFVLVPDRGFCCVESLPFSEKQLAIPESKIGDFLQQHRSFFSQIEGFAVHRTSLASSVAYQVDTEGSLSFVSMHRHDPTCSCGDLVFVEGKGFFPKTQEEEKAFAGLVLSKYEVPSFIQEHQEQLRQIPSFFAKHSPLQHVTFSVFGRPEGIVVEPHFALQAEDLAVVIYDGYTYEKGKGFALISCLPSELFSFMQTRCFPWKQQRAFFSVLPSLQPWIVYQDPVLQPPKQHALFLRSMEQEEKTGSWLCSLDYLTEHGRVPLHEIWKALQEEQSTLITPSGLLDITDPRFHFLKNLSQKRWKQGGRKMELRPVEWIRMQAYYSVTLPEEDSMQGRNTRKAFEAFSSYSPPSPMDMQGLKSTLRSYQAVGVQWLWFLYSYRLSGLLCDEMGLGKTHQAMGLLTGALSAQRVHRPCLIVCPTSVMYHWEELLRTFLPHLRVCVFHGQGRREVAKEGQYDILLTSYGMVRTECAMLRAICFDIAIYDEIQHAKNSKSQIHRSLRSLEVERSFGLTGTPIENRIMDLKALMDLILPKYLPTDAEFRAQFVFPIEKEKDEKRRALLSRVVSPFILRRKKAEVLLELPAKIEEIAYCDLSEEQKALYYGTYRRYKEGLEEEGEYEEGGMIHVFALLSKLKQVCDHPALVMQDPAHFQKYASGKWELFVELLEEARQSGQKVVVFSQYLHMLDIMKNYCKSQAIGFSEIRGRTRDRGAALRLFQEDPKCEVFLASLQAAGVGIDLTAASVVIHYDRWWNPAKENQATDRVHRMGQSRGVQVFKLVTKHTIEEQIHDLIARKMTLLEDVIGFDEKDVMKTFTKEDVTSILASLEKGLEL